MSKQKYSLLVLSFAFLCSDNFSGTLFADSGDDGFFEEDNTGYLNTDEEEYYDKELPSKQKSSKKNSKVTQNQQQNQMSDDQMHDNEVMTGPVCCPEIVEDCCYCNVCPPTDMITPPGGPCVMYGAGIYFTADFIYWTARERETAIAATNGFANSIQIGIPATPTGKVIRFDQTYRPGFKAGFGLDFCHDGWDLFAEYTWYRLTTSKKSSAPQFPNTQESTANIIGLTLVDPYWGLNGTSDVIGQNQIFGFNAAGTAIISLPQSIVYGNVKGKWRLNFNAVNLELGRNFYISRRVMLRPHFGLKGSWQKQNLSVALTNGISNINATFAFSPTHNRYMNQKLTDWGIGPRAGINTSWHFSREFSFLGNIALTGLFEHFSVKRFDFALVPPTGTPANTSNSFVHLKNTFSTIEPVIEWMLGFRWESWFRCDQYHFSLDAGWEEQIWFGQNQFLRNRAMESPEGNLSLAGLTVQARFDF